MVLKVTEGFLGPLEEAAAEAAVVAAVANPKWLVARGSPRPQRPCSAVVRFRNASSLPEVP